MLDDALRDERLGVNRLSRLEEVLETGDVDRSELDATMMLS